MVASNAEDVPIGERLFGYFPPATYLKMTPTHISELRWVDGAEHRASLPSRYNAYRRVLSEPNYNKAMDDFRMLLFPLHTHLGDNMKFCSNGLSGLAKVYQDVCEGKEDPEAGLIVEM